MYLSIVKHDTMKTRLLAALLLFPFSMGLPVENEAPFDWTSAQKNTTPSQKQSFDYSNTVYYELARYAYISKASYCIDRLVPRGADLSQPLVLDPLQHHFLQKGAQHREDRTHDNDRSGFPTELYIAKTLSYTTQDTAEEDQPRSEGFFAVDHSGEGSIILALRGTLSTKDVITNIGINTVDYSPVHREAMSIFEDVECPGCKVHKGFMKKLNDIKEEIFPALQKLIDVFPEYKLVIVGHSLGGSLATLVGLEYALMDYSPLIVTFGSPKVANKELSEFMDTVFGTMELLDDISSGKDLSDGLIRVVHKGDYAPLLPPSSNFHPAGVEFEIEKADLPHDQDTVSFVGAATEREHSVSFRVSDLLSFSFKKILHFQEHTEYFWPISRCDDIHG